MAAWFHFGLVVFTSQLVGARVSKFEKYWQSYQHLSKIFLWDFRLCDFLEWNLGLVQAGNLNLLGVNNFLNFWTCWKICQLILAWGFEVLEKKSNNKNSQWCMQTSFQEHASNKKNTKNKSSYINKFLF